MLLAHIEPLHPCSWAQHQRIFPFFPFCPTHPHHVITHHWPSTLSEVFSGHITDYLGLHGLSEICIPFSHACAFGRCVPLSLCSCPCFPPMFTVDVIFNFFHWHWHRPFSVLPETVAIAYPAVQATTSPCDPEKCVWELQQLEPCKFDINKYVCMYVCM